MSELSINQPSPSLPLPHHKYGMWYVEEDARHAASTGNVKRIQQLLKKYPHLDLNAVNEYEETALYLACKKNQEDVVDFLLKQTGIDANKPTILGNSAILIAVWNDNNRLVKMLLEKGKVDIGGRTNSDRKYHANISALELAKERENKVLEKYLKNFKNDSSHKVSYKR